MLQLVSRDAFSHGPLCHREFVVALRGQSVSLTPGNENGITPSQRQEKQCICQSREEKWGVRLREL